MTIINRLFRFKNGLPEGAATHVMVTDIEKIIHYKEIPTGSYRQSNEKTFNQYFEMMEESFVLTMKQIDELGKILSLSTSEEDYKLQRDAYLSKIPK